jgi:carbohydrate ABC transporter membrane protein 2, CUT1 family (TC 3.A.1.1.-)
MVENQKKSNNVLFFFMTILAITFLVPIFIVLMNSFKGQFFISDAPFSFPTEQTFVGFTNYLNGIEKINFFSAFGYSLFITAGSVLLITICTSMTAWYITRVKSKITSLMYYLFAFSMIVPFQMVMFTMSKTVNVFKT